MKTFRSMRDSRNLIAASAAAILTFLPTVPGLACGPDFPVAVLVNTSHPDLPLSLYANGNLGIIKPSWAKSYLCVSYRYLTSMPLNGTEQASALRLWHNRLQNAMNYTGEGQDDPIETYLELRQKALGSKTKKSPDLYSQVDTFKYQQNIFPDAFRKACGTLNERIKKYGAHSQQVKDWIKNQDVVFGINPNGTISDAAGTDAQHIGQNAKGSIADSDSLTQADRAYQIASAALYSHDYARAASLFSAIAADHQSPWHKLASYLVARAQTNAVLAGDAKADFDSTVALIKRLLNDSSTLAAREDLFDLLKPLTYLEMTPQQIIDDVVASIIHPNSKRFGGDVGDLTFTLDNSGGDSQESGPKVDPSKHDLTDWLKTIQRQDDDYRFLSVDEQKAAAEQNRRDAAHALAQWRAKRSAPWLIAALVLNGLTGNDCRDLAEAAARVPLGSPAYLTCQLFLIDADIKSGKLQSARGRLDPILKSTSLTPSDRNLFQSQRLACAGNLYDFLDAALMTTPVVCVNNLWLPDHFMSVEQQKRYHKEITVLDQPVAEDLNRQLPLSVWYDLCRKKRIPAELHARLVRSTWLRAQLLNRPDVFGPLTPKLAAVYPTLLPLVRRYEEAPTTEAKKFALSALVLKTQGMTPYVDAGIERHGDRIGEFDYYNANYWLPLSLAGKAPEDSYYYPGVVQPGSDLLLTRMSTYYKPGVARLLTAAQKTMAAKEAQTIWHNHPSKFLGDPVFTWMNTHPGDPLIPELLYKINRLPKWTYLTPIGSQYSRKGYVTLHARYPKSPWAVKAECWY